MDMTMCFTAEHAQSGERQLADVLQQATCMHNFRALRSVQHIMHGPLASPVCTHSKAPAAIYCGGCRLG